MTKFPDIDDKDIAMVCIALLGLGALFYTKDSSIVSVAITAIAALATGKKKEIGQ